MYTVSEVSLYGRLALRGKRPGGRVGWREVAHVMVASKQRMKAGAKEEGPSFQ